MRRTGDGDWRRMTGDGEWRRTIGEAAWTIVGLVAGYFLREFEKGGLPRLRIATTQTLVLGLNI